MRKAVRETLQKHLSASTVPLPAEVPLSEVQNHFPMETRNFSDFYCSLEHAINCTKLLRSDGAINQNWYTVPMVYNGHTSSLVVSGTPVHRSCGVFPVPGRDRDKLTFQPEMHMDFELEMGVFLSQPLEHGKRLDINDCRDNMFGFVLLNDLSARQIQLFEMPPQGPFHSKGSGTSISRWIVTTEALEASSDETYDVELSVHIERNGESFKVCVSNLHELYWSAFQQLTHLSSAGKARTDDKGEKTGLGCLFERQLDGNRLASAPADLHATFLKDGDRVVLQGWCRHPVTKEVLFGFGKCEGQLLPAI
ncbi:hypothetical protein SCUCBS95973_001193 [Sporothrix curviconia]|uniref:Fumarylacetoacetase n=1 Tax=Sporothrix curviconia TaxID=1260050 RepID=A0ABP0AWN9_9PEZI